MSSPTELSNKEVVDDQDSSSSCPPSSTSSSSKPDHPVIGEGENTTTTSTTDYPIVFGIQIDEEEIPVTTSREEEHQQQGQQQQESNVTNTTIPHQQQGRLLLSNTVVEERDRGRHRRRRHRRNHNNNDDDRQKQNYLWIIFISGGLCLLLIFLLAFLVSSTTTSQQEGSYYGGTTTPAADYYYDDEDSYEDSYDDHSYDYDYDDYWSQYGNYDNIDYCGESHSGLIVRGTSNACGFPLRSMKIDALAVGEIVQVIMTQEFQTIPMQVYPVITEYTLPLDEHAAVTSFKAEIDSKIIEGIVKERTQAEEEFQEAVDQGLNAYLGEQIRPDIFHMSVGNLPPGKIVRVTIHYVAPLRSVDSNLMQFILPTDTTPRYDPWHNSQDPIPDGQNLINDGVQITLNVLSYTPTFRIFSNTHQIQVSQDDVFGNVVVVDEDPLEHDLVISIETIEGSSNPAVYVEQSNEHGLAMMLSIVPEHFLSNEIFDDSDADAGQDGTTATTRYEFVFVVDRSGSMSSDQKIVQLKRALLYILGTSLPNDALFNIVGFGSRYDVLFPEGSQPRSSHLAQGLAYVNSIQADMGGTEILSPLQYVLNLPPYGEEEEEEVQHNRIVFLITDGEVSNTDDVIEYVATATADDSAMTTGSSFIFTRVFTLGIGAHASRNLVEGVARAGGGTADFVDGDSDEAITSAVERQMEIALSPIINDVDIDWIFALEQPNQVVMIEQAPYYPPPLFQQRRFLMYFLAENPPLGTLPLSMVLTANHFGGQQQQSQSQIVSLEVSTDSFVQSPHDSLLIHQMAARELIRDLEEGRSRFHADGDVNPDVLEGQVRDEIVRLGVKYQIASSETSFIAIDNGEVVEGGEDVPTDEVSDDYRYGNSFTNAPAPPGFDAAPTSPPLVGAGDGQQMGGSADYEAEGDGVVHGQGYDGGAMSIFPLLSFINMLVVAAYLLLSW